MDRELLPEGWKLVTLGEVCFFENGDRGENYPSKSVQTVSGIPFINAGHLTDSGIDFSDMNYIPKERFEILKKGKIRKEDILFCLRGSLGKVASVENLDEGVIASSLVIVRSGSLVLNKFLLSYFKSNLCSQMIEQFRNGAAQPNLSAASLKKFYCPLPPLDEQKRIVAILDEAFEGIDQAIRNTEKNLANARELFDSYLNFKLLPVASGHLIQTLASITDLIVDCEHKTAPTQEIGIPSIRTPNIGKGYLIFDNVNRVSEETYELWTKRAKPISGDLILAREAPAGNVGIIPQGERVCLGQRTVLIRPKKNRIDSQFLAFLLLHPLIQKRLLAKSTGATVQHVNMKDIRELKLSELPSIQTQQKLTKELEDLRSQGDRLETIYRQKIAALNELKQSILQKAFTGQLTK
jgi:type I restriction enzyme S subunit